MRSLSVQECEVISGGLSEGATAFLTFAIGIPFIVGGAAVFGGSTMITMGLLAKYGFIASDYSLGLSVTAIPAAFGAMVGAYKTYNLVSKL